jgi:c-di-GMP-binding flagellar brake protein YcgR
MSGCALSRVEANGESPQVTMALENAIAKSKDAGNGISEAKVSLTVNELLQVKVSGETNSATYYSRVNNLSDGKIIIAWPTNRGIRAPLRVDQLLDLSFVREGIPYAFSGLADETIMEPLPQVSIIPTSAISQRQRRQNFRVKCLVPVEVLGALQNPGNSGGEAVKIVNVKTVTYDLSAGGLAIRHSALIPEGSLVEVKLELPDRGPAIKIPARVAYSESLAGRKSQYQVGLHYLAISERECARIVRYLYGLQIKILQA